MDCDKTEYSYVGKRTPRIDALAKAQGIAKYTADYKTENMLIGKALYSKFPHARIINIDVSKAKALPGVEIVITAQDLDGEKTYGVFAADKPVLAEDKVRYVGDPVAFIAAKDERIAIEGLNLIKVEYEVLPVIDDPIKAMSNDSIQIHEKHPCALKNNIMMELELNKGDVEKAFSEAEVIIENDYKTPMIEHAYLEKDCCIADYDAANGQLTLTVPQQAVYSSLGALAPVFGLPQSKIRLISPYIGGGFGGKEDSCLDVAVIAGILAMKTKRAVFVELSPEEVFRVTGKRHPAYIHHRLAAKRDGKITGIEVEIVLDKGAYASMSGLHGSAHGLTQRTIMYAGSAYNIPNARVKTLSVFTNHPYSGAMRGFGAPQVHFAMESQIDNLAQELNVDPFEIRKINMLRAGDKTICGQVIEESMGLGLPECLEIVEKELKKDSLPAKSNHDEKIGKGVAMFMYGVGMPMKSDGALANVSILGDGSVHVAVSTSEMGQGSNTVFAQLAAETLGVEISNIFISYSDTYITPDSGPTVASRSTTFVGNAIINACNILKDKLMVVASKHLSCDKSNLLYDNKFYHMKDNKEVSVSYDVVCAIAKKHGVFLYETGCWFPPEPSFDEKGQGNPMHAYTFGVHGIEILADKKTGEIEVLKSVFACDAGKAINPMTVEGQLEGGAIMGIGWALTEEVLIKNGVVLNDSLKDFIIPSIKDMPELISYIVEKPNKLGPYGAKGVGEPPLIATAPAIRKAIYNALGIWINTIPFTQERILEAMKIQFEEEEMNRE